MKLSLEMYGDTHSIENDKNDISLDEMLEFFQGLLNSAGYGLGNRQLELIDDETQMGDSE